MKVSQAERKEAKAENDSAIERLRAGNEAALERLRVTIADHNAKVAEQSKDIIKFIATMLGIIVVSISVILGGFITILQFYN